MREVAPPEAETEPADQPAKPVVKRSVKKPGRGTRGAGQRETLPDDAVAEAKDALVRALDAIDAEIETAEDVANKARADCEALRASAAERKAVIQAKIDALELAGTGETTSNAGANKRPRWRGLRAQ